MKLSQVVEEYERHRQSRIEPLHDMLRTLTNCSPEVHAPHPDNGVEKPGISDGFESLNQLVNRLRKNEQFQIGFAYAPETPRS